MSINHAQPYREDLARYTNVTATLHAYYMSQVESACLSCIIPYICIIET